MVPLAVVMETSPSPQVSGNRALHSSRDDTGPKHPTVNGAEVVVW